MMISLAAAALLNSAAAQALVTPDQLPNLFISACLDGSARAADGSVTRLDFSALPNELRSRLGKPSSAQVWKINGSDDAYLYSLNYTERGYSPKICGVASQNLVLRPASAAVETRLRGAPSAGSYKSVEWLNEQAGYRALATRAGGYTILQVNWLRDNPAEVPPTQ
jgi:hypothetical protein